MKLVKLKTCLDFSGHYIYLKNIQFLYRYAFILDNKDLTTKVSEAMKNYKSPTSIKSLLEYITTEQNEQLKIIPFIWYEVFKNRSLINMHEKITMSSMIYRGGYDE